MSDHRIIEDGRVLADRALAVPVEPAGSLAASRVDPSRFTLGPWQVNGVRHSGDLKIGRDTRLHMVGPDGDAVAAVFFDMRTGHGLPDARLIAAAPELYGQLGFAVKLLDALPGFRGTAQLDRMHAALAKARGGLA